MLKSEADAKMRELADAIAYLRSWHDWEKPPTDEECDRLDIAFGVFLNSDPNYQFFVEIMSHTPFTAGETTMLWHAMYRARGQE